MKSCFFISRIGHLESKERKHSDKLLERIVSPVVKELGYDTPKRADQLTEPGTITAQVYKLLWESDLVIADLTGNNPNVYYELAVRHFSKRPFVHMFKRREKLSFDLASERAVPFEFDVAEIDDAKRSLRNHIRSAERLANRCRTVLSDTIGNSEILAAVKGPVPVEKAVMETVLSALQSIQIALQGGATIKTSYGLPSLPHPAFPEGTLLFEGSSRKFYFSDTGYRWSPLVEDAEDY